MGRISKAEYSPQERLAIQQRLAARNFTRENRLKGACVRAAPNYRARSGSFHGKIGAQGFANIAASLGYNPQQARAECGRLGGGLGRRYAEEW